LFARTKRGAERLAKKLALTGVKTAAIHGGPHPNQRNMALRGFRKARYRVLVGHRMWPLRHSRWTVSRTCQLRTFRRSPRTSSIASAARDAPGAGGTASTFGRAQRSEVEIARIERTLAIRMIRCASPGRRLPEKGLRAGHRSSRSRAGAAPLALVRARAEETGGRAHPTRSISGLPCIPGAGLRSDSPACSFRAISWE